MDDYIFFRVCACIGDDLYFFFCMESLFGKINVNNGNVTYLTNQSKRFLAKPGIFYDMISVENRYICTIDHAASCLLIYDTKNNEMSEAETGRKYGKLYTNIAGFFYLNGKIYVYPCDYSEVIIYDLNTKKISYSDTGIKDNISVVCPAENKIVAVSESSEFIYVSEIGNKNPVKINFKFKGGNFKRAKYNNGKVYLLDTKGTLCSFNLTDNTTELICELNQFGEFVELEIVEDKIIIPPYKAECFFIIDTSDYSINRYELSEEFKQLTAKQLWGICFYSCRNDNYIFFSPNCANMIPCLNIKSLELSCIRPIQNTDKAFDYILNSGAEQFFEGNILNLNRFLNSISALKSTDSRSNINAGKNIHEIIKRVANNQT